VKQMADEARRRDQAGGCRLGAGMTLAPLKVLIVGGYGTFAGGWRSCWPTRAG